MIDVKHVLKWLDRIWTIVVVAIIVYVLSAVLVVASFRVPTGSMEPAILPGDYILVNKLIFGPRIFNLWAAADKRPFTVYRLWGWREVDYNDVLVFNRPSRSSRAGVEFDLMSYFAKRCVALPGDTIEIRNWRYKVRGKDGFPLGNVSGQELAATLYGDCDEARTFFGKAYPAYPKVEPFAWTIQDFGPLYVPAAGSKVALTQETAVLYRKYIEWETGQALRLDTLKNEIFLGKEPVKEYIFKKNYYFAAGDNVMNSGDSRYWGLVPEEFIVGVAVCVWKSSRGTVRFIN